MYQDEVREIVKVLLERFSSAALFAPENAERMANARKLASRLLKRATSLTGERPGSAPHAVAFLKDVIASGEVSLPPHARTYDQVLRYWQTWLTGQSNRKQASHLKVLYHEWVMKMKIMREAYQAELAAQKIAEILGFPDTPPAQKKASSEQLQVKSCKNAG